METLTITRFTADPTIGGGPIGSLPGETTWKLMSGEHTIASGHAHSSSKADEDLILALKQYLDGKPKW